MSRPDWTIVDIAAYLGLQPGTVQRYLTSGLLPKPDRTIPGGNFWQPRTIIDWHAKRRPRAGQQPRTDRQTPQTAS